MSAGTTKVETFDYTAMVDADGNVISASGGSSGATTIANGADISQGATTDAAYNSSNGSASGTIVSLLKGLYAAMASGFQQVVGNVASGVADTGNPVKIGGIFNTTPPVLTTGQRTDVQTDNRGNIGVSVSNGVTRATVGVSGDGSTVQSGLYVWSQNTVFDGTSLQRQRGDVSGTYVISKGGSSMATGQVSVGTTSTLVVPARTGRQKVTLSSTSAVVYYVGNVGVTSATGAYVAAAAGASITLDTAAAVYAVGASTVTLSYIELF